MREKLIPCDLALLVSGHAPQHATQCSLSAGGNLVVRVPRCNAVDEGAVFLAIGKLEIVRECSVCGEVDLRPCRTMMRPAMSRPARP